MKKGTALFLSALSGGAIGIIGGAVCVYRQEREKLIREQATTRKDDAILKAYSHWLQRKQQGESLTKNLEKMGCKKIAVYGMHYLGESLLSELEGGDIEVVCAIDKHPELRYTDIPLQTPEEDIPDVDAVIVTAFTFFDEIEEMLSNKVSCPIVSIEDIIYA